MKMYKRRGQVKGMNMGGGYRESGSKSGAASVWVYLDVAGSLLAVTLNKVNRRVQALC